MKSLENIPEKKLPFTNDLGFKKNSVDVIKTQRNEGGDI